VVRPLEDTARCKRQLHRVALVIVVTSLASIPAVADVSEPQADEAGAIEDCNRRTCTMLLERNSRGDDLKCDLTKTWARSTIKRAERLGLHWAFGDVRCSVRLHVNRADIVGAVTQPEYKLELPAHTADCVIEEGGELHQIKAKAAPTIVFAKGRAEKIWINLVSADGAPSITRFLRIVTKLEDATGLFHAAMVEAVNKYIYAQCPRKYPQALASPKS
jgi:hypothetical protein